MKVIYISIAVVIIDQLSKFFVKGFSIPFLNFNFDGMYYGQSIPVIGDFFRLTYIENPGMAFGFDPGDGFKLAISLFSLIASVGLLIYLYAIRNKSLSLRIAIAFILGGAVGNLIDRTFYGVFFGYAPLFYGRVVDFFDFDFFDFTLFGRSYDRWPIFNIADAAVTVGVLILILFYKKHEEERELEKSLFAASLDSTNSTHHITPDELTSAEASINTAEESNEQIDNRKEVSD
ncbi:Signal peptidase II [Ignavibacterium album JCM 16511]|uniref:Lipoprotein signal peptidase n=1 Tax=Ignavibacterium album (strain DSM 19864 / JCM 16511 / NBRC 101810 / Mat9-16) TaxID=945713 RepID=I0AGT0_IGNAJ|nr:signal peptidase II [Ignavibacterium album]AFH48187.1 Signal peptidase II [Ignavibacterium album JCM 16511]